MDQMNYECDESSLSFQQCYFCYSFLHADRPNFEDGDKIIMPPSAFDRLASLIIDFPMMFEIRNVESRRVSHCGVLEFTAEEGTVFLPQWMIENMGIHEGDLVQVTSASLQKGNYVKLQPHTKDFIELSNPRAVLEAKLRNFSCLSTGDTIMIRHNDKKFYIDIVETRPSSAISIVETDCEADFAPPLDYKEPEKPTRSLIASNHADQTEEEPKFRPFSGTARRLDGQPSTTGLEDYPMAADKDRISEEDSKAKVGLRKHSGKLVCGFNGIQNTKKPADETSKKQEKKFEAFTGNKYTLAG